MNVCWVDGMTFTSYGNQETPLDLIFCEPHRIALKTILTTVPNGPDITDPTLVSLNNPALLRLRRAGSGVPRVFELDRYQLVKCIVCDGVCEEGVVCRDCGTAIAVVREIGTDNLRHVGQAIVRHGFAQVLELIAQKGLKEWMERELRDM